MTVDYPITEPPHVVVAPSAARTTHHTSHCHLPDGEGGHLCTATSKKGAFEQRDLSFLRTNEPCMECCAIHPNDEYVEMCGAPTREGHGCTRPAHTCHDHDTDGMYEHPPILGYEEPDCYPLSETPHLIRGSNYSEVYHLPTTDDDPICGQSGKMGKRSLSGLFGNRLCVNCLAEHPNDEYVEMCGETMRDTRLCTRPEGVCQYHGDDTEVADLDLPSFDDLDPTTENYDVEADVNLLFEGEYTNPDKYLAETPLYERKDVLYALYWECGMTLKEMGHVFDMRARHIGEKMLERSIPTRDPATSRWRDDPVQVFVDDMRCGEREEEDEDVDVDWSKGSTVGGVAD